MKEEKFKIIQFTREFIVRIENELDNFPKKDLEIKKKIREESYNLLEEMYEVNITESIERKCILLENGIAKVKVIDFLINLSYDRKLITQKMYVRLSEKLDDIVKYISGLLKNINSRA